MINQIKMRFSRACFVAVAFLLVSPVVQSFSELVILHEPSHTEGHKLTCISEDDNGAALTWNYDPWKHSTGVADFMPRIPTKSGNLSYCAVRNASDCLAEWDTTYDWHVESSVKKPKGPIFDHRWEGLKEYNFNKEHVDNQTYQHVGKVKSSGSMWFSARGNTDLYVYMCENKDPPKGPCIWMLIAGWGGTKSVIKYCASGAREPEGREKACDAISKYDIQKEPNIILDLYEWRTFKIEWNSENKTIKIFESDASEPFLTGRKLEWSEEFYVSVRGEDHGRIRFHVYEYYFTETSDAVITTKEFAHSGKLFHAELLVTLCPKCNVSVRLVDKYEHNVGTWTASGVEINSDSDRLTWQSMKLITTLDSDDRGDLKFEIRTTLDENAGTGRWAIDNFRVYEAGDKTRRSNLTLTNGTEKFTCQKLSYTGVHEIVSSSVHQLGTSEVKSQLQNFIHHHKEPDIGRYGYMCDANECTCGRGFVGEYCADGCNPSFYGYGCAKKCGSCLSDENCDPRTGFCQNGCKGHRIRPFCQTNFEAPTVESIEDQGVTVIQKIELDAAVVTSVHALIVEMEVNPQIPGGNEPTKAITLELKRSGNSPIFEGSTAGLKLSTVYKVLTALTVTLEDQGSGSPLTTNSSVTKFATTCYGKSKFEIVPHERGFTVQEWNKDCTIESSINRWYVTTTDASTHQSVGTPDLFTSVPFDKTDLEPAKNYTVMIRDTKLDYEWLLPEIQTSESAPSKVQELNTESTNTTVTVSWKPPLKPNGHITHYKVTIKLRYFKGCTDYGEKSPSKEAIVQNVANTATIFENLDPYATYVVNVIAYNSKEGISDERTFDTQSNAIPTSMVRNLRFNKTANRIEWDNPDCTTVTGPANVTRVLLRREVDTSWNEPRYRDIQTNFLFLEEYVEPYEPYRVRVYVARCYQGSVNADVYQERKWNTNPAAPPAVRDLTIYEVDSKTVSLQWMPPDPANGELESYVILIRAERDLEYSNITLNVTETTYCNQREGFLCYENLELPPDAANSDVQIEVFAKNKDVEEIGMSATLTLSQEFYEQAPRSPIKVEVYASESPGGVTMKWRPPWYSPTKIARYAIRVVFVKTDLLDNIDWNKTRSWTVDFENPYQEFYTTNLSLFPSTTYNFFIKSESQRGHSSIEIPSSLRVPESVGLDGKLDLRQESESSIEVKVPRIINATKHTWVNIIVQGIRTCVDRHSQTPLLPEHQKLWIAKSYQVNDTEKRKLSLSGNDYSDESSNCSFRIGEPYRIIINVLNRTSNSTLLVQIEITSGMTLIPEEPQKSNLAWLVVIPILIIFVLLAFVIKYRKREKRPLLDSAKSQTVSNSPIPWNLKETPIPVPVAKPEPKSTPDVIPFNPLSHPVGIEDFEEYTKDGLKSGLLTSQYEEFPKGLTKPCEYGRLPANASKNRWANLIAYDDTRVVLETLEDPHSDYINASYIPGYQNEKAYIATQGPKPETMNDFWRMVWQEKVRIICMLANVIEHGRTKCAQYWPDIGEQILHGDILISNINQVVYINYTIRTLEVKFKKNKREVTHLHYTGWPDHGVPMFTQSVVPYLKKLQATATGNEPIVVHCSAGVGRTGTIILCDTALRQAKSEMVVDLAAVTERMRKYRARMVDNEQQYVFAHLAIVEYILSEQTEIPCNEYSNGRINDARKLLITHIKRVKNIIWGERVMQSIGEPTSPLPDDVARDGNMELDLADPSMGLFGPVARSYVNRKHVQTVSIDGSKIENQFLMTWLPSPSTRSEIWELIADDNIELVIVLQRPDEKDPTCCNLMPSDSDPVSSRSVEVEFKGCFEEDEDYSIDKLSVSKNSEIAKEPQSVTVITCHGWGRGAEGEPPSVGALVSLWMASEKVSRSESPTLVLCHDGVTGCGLYVALSFLLERIAVEKECDVISAVRKVRRSKPEFGQSIEQFEYLYDATLNYVDRFKLYANYS